MYNIRTNKKTYHPDIDKRRPNTALIANGRGIPTIVSISRNTSAPVFEIYNFKELRKIIHATWIPDSKHNPYVNVHGYKFVLKSDRPE